MAGRLDWRFELADVSFIEQGYEILEKPTDPIGTIARAARTCYRSEASASPENDRRLVSSLVNRGHEAMLEHDTMSVRFTCDRGVSHELVRHRLFSFAQESTRYVNYAGRGFLFIMPVDIDGAEDAIIRQACRYAAEKYELLIAHGTKPEDARAILPNMTATQIVVTGNLREWRHMLTLRCDSHAHPQIRALMTPLLQELKDEWPELFGDIA